jgi:pyruvate/2-oxoglutarate dehydrogenase complex dihydrolipoamide acyltransferase (E2) component
MKFEFDLRVGDRVIRISDEAANATEFFQKMAFWDTIPHAGPNGEAELKFSFRTPKGCEYYSIECGDAGKEFKFGQFKADKTRLFPKTWESILHGAERYEEEETAPASEQPKADAKKQEPKPPSQSSKTDPAGDINQNDDVDLNKRAKRLVAEGRVTKSKDGRYTVKVNDKVTYDVWRGEDGRVKCSCARFKKWSASDATFRCEHIWSVKFFADSQQAAA